MDPLKDILGRFNDALTRVLKSGRKCRHGLDRRRPDPPQRLGGAPADARVGTAPRGGQCRPHFCSYRPDLPQGTYASGITFATS